MPESRHNGETMYKMIWVATAAAALAMSGCATITKGSSQSVTVLTDPNGAECRFDRAGQSLAIVNPTPGTVQIDKSKDAITIRCKKDGYMETAGTLDSEFQGMTFGNILFGGIIGVAVDAGSGAMNQYPSSLTLNLVPESFPSSDARDLYFDNAALRVRAETSQAVQKTKETCLDDDGCASNAAKVQAAGDLQIARIESQRMQAQIRP